MSTVLVLVLGLVPVVWHQVSGHRLFRPMAPATEHEKHSAAHPRLRLAQNAGWLTYLVAVGVAAVSV